MSGLLADACAMFVVEFFCVCWAVKSSSYKQVRFQASRATTLRIGSHVEFAWPKNMSTMECAEVQSLEHGRLIASARQYVKKSNCGDVGACLAMFSPNAVYGSTTVGGHEGIDAITDMMTGFFSKFPAVNWQVEEYTISKVSFTTNISVASSIMLAMLAAECGQSHVTVANMGIVFKVALVRVTRSLLQVPCHSFRHALIRHVP